MEDTSMGKTILIMTHYNYDRETAIRLRNGRTATKRQYIAALSRLRASLNDGLRLAERRINPDGSRIQPKIVVYDERSGREYALIS
jgi:hypothetical protein